MNRRSIAGPAALTLGLGLALGWVADATAGPPAPDPLWPARPG